MIRDRKSTSVQVQTNGTENLRNELCIRDEIVKYIRKMYIIYYNFHSSTVYIMAVYGAVV